MASRVKKTKKTKDVEVCFYIPQEVVIVYERKVKIPRRLFDKVKSDDVALQEICRLRFEKSSEVGESQVHDREYGDYAYDALEVDMSEVPE